MSSLSNIDKNAKKMINKSLQEWKSKENTAGVKKSDRIFTISYNQATHLESLLKEYAQLEQDYDKIVKVLNIAKNSR